MVSEVPLSYMVGTFQFISPHQVTYYIFPPELDPNDPLKNLYDVDDESTVITLSDWYHVLAPAGTNQFFTTGIVPCVVHLARTKFHTVDARWLSIGSLTLV